MRTIAPSGGRRRAPGRAGSYAGRGACASGGLSITGAGLNSAHRDTIRGGRTACSRVVTAFASPAGAGKVVLHGTSATPEIEGLISHRVTSTVCGLVVLVLASTAGVGLGGSFLRTEHGSRA